MCLVTCLVTGFATGFLMCEVILVFGHSIPFELCVSPACLELESNVAFVLCVLLLLLRAFKRLVGLKLRVFISLDWLSVSWLFRTLHGRFVATLICCPLFSGSLLTRLLEVVVAISSRACSFCVTCSMFSVPFSRTSSQAWTPRLRRPSLPPWGVPVQVALGLVWLLLPGRCPPPGIVSLF